jgi:hypothetical protein
MVYGNADERMQRTVMETAYLCAHTVKQTAVVAGLDINSKALRALYNMLLNELETKEGNKPCRHGKCKPVDADRLL